MQNTFTPFLTVVSGLFAHHTEYDTLGQLNTVLLIQKRYTFRISEVLNLNIESLSDDFNIHVKLSKCNEYSVIRDEEIHSLLKSIFNHNYNNSFTITYKNYYNYLLKYHNGLIIKSNTDNNKVTHSFRYRKAQKLKASDKDPKIIKASLHHQSVKSQKYYLKLKN